MGQAKRRGSFEERKAHAVHVEQLKTLSRTKARQLRYHQESEAFRLMVWWQFEMSAERYDRIKKSEMEYQMAMAQTLGVLAWSFYGN
jgi:hypothetical protein